MKENQTYFYMRLKENFFDSNELVVLESLPEGYLFSNILLKLYLRSLRDEGRLMFNNAIPFNAQMIATITRHNVETVEKALDTFQRMGLIEILDSGAIYMLNIQNYIGRASTAADRQREYHNRIANEKRGKVDDPEATAKKPGKKSCKKSYKDSAPEGEKKAELEGEPESGGKISFLLQRRMASRLQSIMLRWKTSPAAFLLLILNLNWVSFAIGCARTRKDKDREAALMRPCSGGFLRLRKKPRGKIRDRSMKISTRGLTCPKICKGAAGC